MTFSISLSSNTGDKYYVYLDPLYEGFSKDLHLPEDNIEIYQIVLDREKGDNITDLNILHQISEFLAKIVLANRNVILYYVCDDLNEIPNSNHNIPWQEYRSRLFSSMFERYVNQTNISDIIDTPLVIRDAVGNNQYIHILAVDEHQASVNTMVDFIIDGFAAGK